MCYAGGRLLLTTQRRHVSADAELGCGCDEGQQWGPAGAVLRERQLHLAASSELQAGAQPRMKTLLTKQLLHDLGQICVHELSWLEGHMRTCKGSMGQSTGLQDFAGWDLACHLLSTLPTLPKGSLPLRGYMVASRNSASAGCCTATVLP